MPTPMRPKFAFARRPRLRADLSRRSRAGRALAALLLAGLPGTLFVAGSLHRANAQDDAVPTTQTARRGVLTTPLAVDWKFTSVAVRNNPAAPIITNDTAYFAAGNRLYAVDLATGTQKWRYPSGDATLQTQVLGSPTLDRGTIFFGTGEGLYAIDATTGKQLWQPYIVKGGVETTPVVIDTGVYFASQAGQLYGLNTKTGELLDGVYRQNARTGINTGGDLINDMTVVDNIAYYVTANNQALHAVDLVNGLQKWAIRLPNTPNNNTRPVLSGDRVLLATGNVLLSLRSASGQQTWSRVLESEVAIPPAVDDDGNAYIITTDRHIYALDARNKPMWRQSPQLDNEPVISPIIANKMLIAGTAGGGLYAYDLETGALRWNYSISPSSSSPSNLPADANVSSRPVVSGASLYVLTDDGTLTAFRHDAVDLLPPIITPFSPEQGDYLNGRPPFRIQARVEDEGSGLNLNTLTLKLDDKPIARRPPPRDNGDVPSDKPGYVYHPEDGSVDFMTQESETGRSSALSDGHHSVTLSVSDWKGNTATKTWSFLIDDTIPTRVRRPGGGNPGFPGGGSGPGRGGRGGFPGGGRGGFPGSGGKGGGPASGD